MKLIENAKIWKELNCCEKGEQMDDFKFLVDEIKNKYSKKEIGVKRAGNLSGSIKGCKALIITGNGDSIDASALKDTELLKMVIIQDGVKNINANCFKDCDRLQFVYFPKSIRCVEDSAFRNCYSLKDVIFEGEGNLSINQNAFRDCENLQKVSIKNGFCNIGSSAFEGCRNLRSVLVKGDVVMGDYAFWGCKNLNYIKFGNFDDVMRHSYRVYFENYVYDEYDKERQINHRVECGALLEIKADKSSIKMSKNAHRTRYPKCTDKDDGQSKF